MASFAAGRRGREVRRADGNPHDRPYCQERGLLTRQQMDELRAKYAAELQEAHKKVRQEPQPKGDSIYQHIFQERDLVREDK
jgi:TPP-dependent pyruvate/acetoin dehydrogenase alpha subunit